MILQVCNIKAVVVHKCGKERGIVVKKELNDDLIVCCLADWGMWRSLIWPVMDTTTAIKSTRETAKE